MKIVGQKAGGSKQRKPVIAPDTAQSKTIAKIMYGLSEGVIKGLVEGGKSIYLDDTPIVAENGQQNFDRVGYEFRAGTNDQTYIKGFEEVASEIAVGVELKHSRPWVKSLRNLELDAVTIRIRFAALRQTNDSNGDVSGTTVEYAIDTMTDGTAWVEYGRYKVSDKTSAGYERTHRVDLPKARTGWQIRVRRLTADNHSDYLSNQSYIQAYTEIIDAKMAYPNTALLAINYDSEIFSNVPKMSVECYGVEILVPSNYDPVTRQYSGVWNGSFKRAYTDNPAWHFYDACINKRYALGYRIDSSMIDKWSIYRIAQYCDELVDDGKGGREPRFTLNVYEQSEDSAWSVLSKMAGAFRAFVYWDGTAIICDADIPQDTFYTFTAANVIDGIFEYSGTAPRDRHTVARVAWNNPSNRYKTEYVIVRDDAAISMHGIKIVDIQAYGCTSESQAQRAGLWALKSEQLETQTVTFKTGLDGFIPLPGKIIEIADPYYMGADNGGRIVAVNARQNEITVDRDDVVCNVGDRLVVNTANGVAQARIVKSIRGRVITVVSPFDNVQVESIWVVDAHRIATRKFRVISVRQDDSHQFTITALQHNPAKYDVIDNGAYIDERPTSLLNTSVQTPVNNVQISSRQHIEQGLNVTTLIISFDQAPNATKYLIEWKKDDNPWQRLPETGKNSVEISNVYAGQYQVRVTAISGFGVASLASYSSLTQIAGKAGRPNRPAFIRATGTLFGMRLDWGFNSKSEDTNYTEIQVSPDGRSNIATLGTFAYPTDKHEIQGLQGNLTQFYRARIVDKLGNTSDWTAWANGTTDANPEKIINLMSGHISEGMLDGVLTGKLNKLNQDYRLLDGKIAQEARDRAEAVRAEVTRTNREIDNRIKTAKQGIDQQIKQVSDGANTTLEQFNSYKQSNDRALGAVSTLVNSTVNNVSAVSQRVDRVESNITTVQNGLATKADSSVLVNYYTKSETDRAVAGKVEEFKSTYNEKLAELQKSLKSSELDLRQLDPNTYYPVTFTGLSRSEIRLIRVFRNLGDFPEKPTWAKHQSGFSLSCEWSVNGHGWGSIAVTRNISSFAFAWISDNQSPLIMIGQMTNSSQEYCYLRGGARYKLEAHPDIVATIRTTSYSLHSQTVAPMAYNADLVPKADKQAIQALIAEESRARATAMESIAETVRDHTTTLNGYSSTIRQQTQSINGISNLYAIKVDNNGVMSGFGLTSELINGQVRSEFGINADNFYIGNPANGKKPFIFNASPRVIDGVSYPAGTFINTAFIASATIKMAHIQDSIQSDNFVQGRSGWRLYKNGSLEINGSLGDGTRIQLNHRGLVGYYANGKKAFELGIFE